MKGEYIVGELRSEQKTALSYHITEENPYFSVNNDSFYRHNEVYRSTYDKHTGNLVSKNLIVRSHAKVMYEAEYIPKHMIVVK